MKSLLGVCMEGEVRDVLQTLSEARSCTDARVNRSPAPLWDKLELQLNELAMMVGSLERRVEHLEDERSALVENIKFGVLIEDASRRVSYANKTFCQLFGVPLAPQQLVGLACSELGEQAKLSFERSEEFLPRILEITEAKIPVHAEELVMKCGRIIERDYIPVWSNGSFRGHLWQFHDVTEQRQIVELRERFAHQVLQAQDRERRKIAREIHDSIGASLTSLSIRTRMLDEIGAEEDYSAHVNQLQKLTAATLGEAQRLAKQLHPLALEQLGIAEAIRQHAEDLSQAHQMPIDVDVMGDWQGVSETMATALYRVVQEALNNVMKHSGADHVSVFVERKTSEIRAVVEDNGHGFIEGAETQGMGLQSMRERVSLLKGELSFETPPRGGTAVCLRIPAPAFDKLG